MAFPGFGGALSNGGAKGVIDESVFIEIMRILNKEKFSTV